jgi:flagellar biosynthetic protein FliO
MPQFHPISAGTRAAAHGLLIACGLLLLCLSAQAQTANVTPAATVSPSPWSESQPQSGDERLPFMTADRERKSELSGAEQPSVAGLLLRTLGALLLIVGMIVAATWWLRRYGGARFGRTVKDAPVLEVLATVPLGERRSLSVVRFGERTLLIGSTTQGITLLATHAPAKDESKEENRVPARVSVADLLERETGAPDFAQELVRADAAYTGREVMRQEEG